MKKWITAREANTISEHAKDRMNNSDEFNTIMNSINEWICGRIEEGSDYTYIHCSFMNNIDFKWDKNIFLKAILSELRSLGFEVEYDQENTKLFISWEFPK